MRARLATPARVSGYVTEQMCREHGSFRAALEHLNATTPKQGEKQ